MRQGASIDNTTERWYLKFWENRTCQSQNRLNSGTAHRVAVGWCLLTIRSRGSIRGRESWSKRRLVPSKDALNTAKTEKGTREAFLAEHATYAAVMLQAFETKIKVLVPAGLADRERSFFFFKNKF